MSLPPSPSGAKSRQNARISLIIMGAVYTHVKAERYLGGWIKNNKYKYINDLYVGVAI
jgi:hypothetical protein